MQERWITCSNSKYGFNYKLAVTVLYIYPMPCLTHIPSMLPHFHGVWFVANKPIAHIIKDTSLDTSIWLYPSSVFFWHSMLRLYFFTFIVFISPFSKVHSTVQQKIVCQTCRIRNSHKLHSSNSKEKRQYTFGTVSSCYIASFIHSYK